MSIHPLKKSSNFQQRRWSKAGRPSRNMSRLGVNAARFGLEQPPWPLFLSKYLPNWQILGFYISKKKNKQHMATNQQSSNTKSFTLLFLVPKWILGVFNPSEQPQQLTTSSHTKNWWFFFRKPPLPGSKFATWTFWKAGGTAAVGRVALCGVVWVSFSWRFRSWLWSFFFVGLFV